MSVQLSIVMPCLNESDTVATCVGKAVAWLKSRPDLTGEVLVADNGSTDGSQALAEGAGATVLAIQERGYGSALIGGIAAARGEWVIMGDADDSYDFSKLDSFVERLQAGADLVQGCRLPSGGGRIEPNAMPISHRLIGNPLFSNLARWWFGAPLHDIYCGLRGFRRDFQQRLNQRCTGMEFATEMVIKACLQKARIEEVPIVLHVDGRKSHGSHLRTFRDGFRTLRFFLLYAPAWLFLLPGAVLSALGLLGYAVALPGMTFGAVKFDAHTLMVSSLALICGFQAVTFFLFANVFAVTEGILPRDGSRERLLTWVGPRAGTIFGLFAVAGGLSLLVFAVLLWRSTGYSSLDYAYAMRIVIPGVTLTALGFQSILSSFLLSILWLHRK